MVLQTLEAAAAAAAVSERKLWSEQALLLQQAGRQYNALRLKLHRPLYHQGGQQVLQMA